MTKQELTAWAIQHGWTMDRWGHLRSKAYRLRLSNIAVRLEAKTSAGWTRLRSNYFSRITLTADGHLLGLLGQGCGGDR